MNRGLIAPALLACAAILVAPPAAPQTAAPPAATPQTARSQTAAQPAGEKPSVTVDQLHSADPKSRAKAARELGKAGEPSTVPALVSLIADPSVSVRREVVIALSRIRVPASLDPLIRATRDPAPEVRLPAVQGLIGYYTGQTPSEGFTGFFTKQYRRARSRFESDDRRIDPGAVVDPKVITALVEVMGNVQFIHAAREAAKGLGILMAQAAVPNLVEAAHSSDEDLDREALNALAKIRDRSAGPRLVDLLDSPKKDVKRDAAVTVGILRTREALPRLQAMFENDPDPKSRKKALEGLAYLGDPVSVPLFTKALWDHDKEIRTSAAEGLARVADPKALPEVEKAIAVERDLGATIAMEFAITAMGKSDHLADMVHALAPRGHTDAVQAYLRELARNPKFLPNLYPYLADQNAAVRKRLCTVLMFAGDQTTLDHLERLSHDSNGEVASEALRAMRAIRARSATATRAELRR